MRVGADSSIPTRSQSFNTVNVLRQLGRWMRMFTVRVVANGSTFRR